MARFFSQRTDWFSVMCTPLVFALYGLLFLIIDLFFYLQRKLEKINSVLLADYECRRRMLIKRLDVTVQSFGWSDRAKAG